jgi:hypothetical protein
MTEVPAFFVPKATPENQESIYASFADSREIPIPILPERIYSITFIHNREEWIATVGQALRGSRHKTTRSIGKKVEQIVQLSDPAIVLAIFPGTPFTLFTNHRIDRNVGSVWENPFYVGEPKSVTHFPVL